VVDKASDAVLDEIEATVYQIAASILAGNGFSYDIPSRAKGNQLYVPELDRIVLKDSVSKRPFASTQQCRCALRVRRGAVCRSAATHGGSGRRGSMLAAHAGPATQHGCSGVVVGPGLPARLAR
jgi:hypothetical protein